MKTAHMHQGFASVFTAALGLAGLLLGSALHAEAYFDKYDLSPSKGHVDIGVQPMAYPLAFISSTMQRDRTLRSDLKGLGLALRPFSFRKGNDMVELLGGGKLEFALLGDMPTVNTLVRTPTAIAGLGKRNFSSVVSRDYSQIESLKGKRIGYSAGSSSHLVLLRGLKAARMQETDVTLVAMEPSQMPDALENGTIDAFSAWEPTPSISIARNSKNRAIYRGMSTDWVVVSQEFADQQPQAALLLVASYARAINWMRAASANVERAGGWVLGDGESFTAQPRSVSLAKAVEIARKDLLEVPGAPAVPAKVDGMAPLTREFDFLQQQGRIPAGVGVDRVTQAFAYTGLKQVQADPKKYRLFVYDYDQ
jgi:ABC-type taurine transport system substrate-binding protein